MVMKMVLWLLLLLEWWSRWRGEGWRKWRKKLVVKMTNNPQPRLPFATVFGGFCWLQMKEEKRK